MGTTDTGGAAPSPGPLELLLPGTAAASRAVHGVLGPQDVPRWASTGAAPVRRAAVAVSAEAVTVRRAGETLQRLLLDPASAPGWYGSGAAAAQGRARSVTDRLVSVTAPLERVGEALGSLAVALAAQEGALASPEAAWVHAGEQERPGLLRRWRPAVQALDAADARTAEALHGVATALAGVRGALRQGRAALGVGGGSRVSRPGVDGRDPGPAGPARYAGDLCRGTVDGIASLGNAAGRHPEAVVQLVAGLLLTELGAGGEVAGAALDATGIGAVVGVPANVASAAVVATGLGLAGTAAGRLVAHAAGDDRVMLMGSGESPPARSAHPIDISDASFAQRTARSLFSTKGSLSGRTIDEVATGLREGRLHPEDVPVDVIRRNGRVFLLNTRSSLALQKAGIERSRWYVTDRTGQAGYERRLSNQLRINRLDSSGTDSVRIKGRNQS